MRHSKRPDHLRMCSSPPEAAIDEPGIDSPVFSLKVTTGDGNTSELPISADVLADMFRSVPDSPEMGWLFDLAARHPSMKVRATVARYENLSPGTVQLLGADSSSEVRKQLVSSAAFKEHAGINILHRLAASDPILAMELAEHIDDFNPFCARMLETILGRHPDPSVRLIIAQNGRASASTVACLAKDPDPAVALAAYLRSLAER